MQLRIKDIQKAGPLKSRGINHDGRLLLTPSDPAATSPFLVLGEERFAPPAGFPSHPHRGMETVTFVVDGQLFHHDHIGASGALEAGDVEFMTAGAGAVHSEMPGSAGVRILQLWLNLPAELKRTPARYKVVSKAKAPVHQRTGVEARIYAGSIGGLALAHGTVWPLTLIDLTLEGRATFEMPINAGERAFAVMIDGEAALGEEQRAVGAGDIAWFDLGTAPGHLSIRAPAWSPARVLIFASPVIDEPVVMDGPFVMNSEQEITEAFEDFRAGRFASANPAR